MAKQVTTLFIEDTAIRLLVAKGKHAEKWASVPLEQGLVKHGQIQDKVRVAEKLKETFKWAQAGNRVVLGLSEPGSLYRIITLPKLPEAILPEAVKREAERVIPLPQDEIYLSYQIISVHQDDMQLFLAAYSRTAVDTLISTLQAAGIKPSSLDLVPLALCRAIDRLTAIVVSLRSSNFEIAIMADNIPQVIRSLSLPGDEESLVDKLPTIAEELERTVTFYNSSHADKPLDNTVPVFVDGELVHVPDSWPALVGSMGYTVMPLPSIMQTEKEFDASQFTVNFGLALKENQKDNAGSIINFNALPPAFLPEKTKISRVILPIGAGVAILLLIFVWIQTSSIKVNIKQVQTEISLAQSRSLQATKDSVAIQAQITQVQAQIKPLQEQIDAAGATSATFQGLTLKINAGRTVLMTEVNSIIGLAPDGLTLSSITIDNNIKLSGISADTTLIYQYAKDLIASGNFGSLDIQSITLGGDSYNFAIGMNLK